MLSLMLTPLILILLLPTALSTTSSLIHLPLTRRPVPSTRLFSQIHRPWLSHLFRTANLPIPQIRPLQTTNTTLPGHPIYGNTVSLGEYYLTLHFGSQPINVQIDTGSSTLAVPLSQCRNCRSNDHRLNLATASGNASFVSCDSPTCRPNSCSVFPTCTVCSRRTHACCSAIEPQACAFYLLYADETGASGALVQADVQIAGLTVPLAFGAILKEIGKFENGPVDGIFGMAYRSLACNPSCVTPLFDALVQTGKVKRDVFSVCTAPVGGTLTLGGSDPKFFDGKLKYAPMIRKLGSRHFYDLAVRKVSIGNINVQVPDFSDAIVDSGTTLLILAPRAYKAIKTHFQTKYCNVPGLCLSHMGKQVMPTHVIDRSSQLGVHKGADSPSPTVRSEQATWFEPGYCARLTKEHVAMLPKITIFLNGGVELVLEPDVYMLKYEEQRTFAWDKVVYRCLGISSLEGLNHAENNAILGNTVLQKYFVEYDRENERIGFALGKNCVNPEDKKFGIEAPLGQGQGFHMPHWVVVLLIFGCIISWVMVISVCARERSRDGYRPI